MVDTSKFIRNGDFCKIVTDKFEEHGVKRNHLVYVAGHRALPITEEDPYTQRIKFTCHLVTNNHVVWEHLYLMDANSVQKVSKSQQKKLTSILNEDFVLEGLTATEIAGG
jgi:hypothetical protein